MDEMDPFGESKSRKSSGFSEGHGSGKSRQFSGLPDSVSYANGGSGPGHGPSKSRNCSGNSGQGYNGVGSAPVSIPPGGGGGGSGEGSGSSSQGGQTPPNMHPMHRNLQQAGMFGPNNQLGLVDLTTPTKVRP